MIVLNLSEFQYPSEEFEYYYVLIRSTENVPEVFPRMKKWTSALNITVYYDGADASAFDAKLIVSLISGPVRKLDFTPITQSHLDNLDERIVTILDDDRANEDIVSNVEHDSENKDFCVYLEKISRKRARYTR